MTTPDPDAARLALLGMVDTWTPLYEAAEGQKATLVGRGWSPDAAEKVATEMLCGMLRVVLGGVERELSGAPSG